MPVTAAPRTAIIGTGRSGTGYMSQLVTTAITPGTYCGHEGWWSALGARTPGLFCDASWLALPSIENGSWSGPTVHVVRDPVATVRSLLRTEFFGLIADTPYPQFAMDHCPAAAEALADSPVAAAVEFWADWNARCAAAAQLTVRLEDVSDFEGGADSIGAATIDLIGDVLGIKFGAWEVPAGIPKNVNHDGDHLVTSGLAIEVDEPYIWDRLDRRALALGYAP